MPTTQALFLYVRVFRLATFRRHGIEIVVLGDEVQDINKVTQKLPRHDANVAFEAGRDFGNQLVDEGRGDATDQPRAVCSGIEFTELQRHLCQAIGIEGFEGKLGLTWVCEAAMGQELDTIVQGLEPGHTALRVVELRGTSEIHSRPR